MTNKLTIVERTDAQYHRSHIIIHRHDTLGTAWIFAEFDNVAQLDFFAQTLGFTYTAEGFRETERFGIYRDYRLSHEIIDPIGGGFWSLDEIPEGAKPIKALSNGSIVTCYFTNDGETIRIYRPNPNATRVYSPLSIQDHISHNRIYGRY